MSPTASLQRVWESLRSSIYEHKNKQLLNFHIIAPQILTSRAPNRFQESYNVKYFKVIRVFKKQRRIQNPSEHLLMELFCNYT